MEKAKRKPHPKPPAWEFTTGYTLTECVEQLKAAESSMWGEYRPMVRDIKLQDDGTYSFTVRRPDEFETTGTLEELTDGTTRLYGEYQRNGCISIGLFTLTMLTVIIAPTVGGNLSYLCMLLFILMLAMFLVMLVRDDKTDVRRTGDLLREALNRKPGEMHSHPYP